MKTNKLIDNMLKIVAAAILIAIPLYPKFPLIDVPGTFVYVRLEDFIIAIGGLFYLFKVFPRLKSLLKDKVIAAILIFVAAGLLSLLWAVLILNTVNPFLGILHWLRRIEYLIPLLIGLETIKSDRKNLDFFIKIILLILPILFVYGWGQKYYNWPIIITQNEEYSRGVALRFVPGGHINSTFAGHYDLASFLILVLPLIVSALFLLKTKLTRIILVISWLCGLWLLVNSASRISLVSYLLSVILAFFLIRKYKELFLVLIISVVFVLSSSNLIDRYKRIIEVTTNKIKAITLSTLKVNPVFASTETVLPQRNLIPTSPTPTPVFEDRSTNIRLVVEWPRAIRAFYKNPLTGTGYSSISLATDNDYLRMLGETGVLGILSFGLIFLRLFIEGLRVYPYNKQFKGLELAFIAGITGAIPGILLNGVFIDVFEASKFAITFWLLVGIAISITRNKKYV